METAKVYIAGVLFVTSLIAWPVSMVTFAKTEPPVVLSLSWFAITVSALDVLFTALVARKQKEQDED